jgi:predicted AlkP superfamily phosphohydrolase/phosphomutase
MNRREFLKTGLTAGSFLALGPSMSSITKVLGKTETNKKIIILGFDGMDPNLTDVWIKQGKLPAFQKLKEQGSFTPLQTSNPPQSPVAWSNFITGMDPGGHGIFDFMHRDPATYMPEFSAAGTSGASKTLSLGNYEFPISGGQVENLRKGRAFWQILEEHDIPATIFKIPSNYPPVPNEDLGGARIHEVYVIGNQVEAKLAGPVNSFKKDRPQTEVDFKVYIDPINPVAKIRIQDNEFILQEGEWSDWKRIHFNLIPTQSVSGLCLFYLKQVRPEFKLYISPLNIDPANAALPISTPKSYSQELEKRFGPFFTKGLPADFKALDNNILDEHEFLAQDDIILRERQEMFEYELERFHSGLLFYYVSSTDQRQHIFWRHIDKNNPTYDSNLAREHENAIEEIYIEADKILDKALQKADKNTIVMALSDHGFAPFRRSINLNTWLYENGYHALINKWKIGEDMVFLNTDWSRTKAYAYGLNGLYINQAGREAEGIVSPGNDKDNLIQEIAQKLQAFKDPKTGEKAIRKAYIAKDIYSGVHVDQAPDIIAGFNTGYRISWESPSGRLSKEVITDNTAKWSGDHCVAPDVVPGIFLSNQRVDVRYPAFHDITPTILRIFNIEVPQEITGKPII